MSTETCMTGRCGHVGRWGRKLRQEVGDDRGAERCSYLRLEQLRA